MILLYESGRYHASELLASMTAQRVNEKILDGLTLGGMSVVHAPAALSGAEMDPVPDFVRRSTITGMIHEGLKQQRPVTARRMPVLRESGCSIAR
jgi:hypothetical protein